MLRLLLAAIALLLCASSAWAQTSATTIIVSGAPVYSYGATMTAGNSATNTPASRINAGPGCSATGNTNGSNCWEWQALNSGTTSGSGNPVSSWTCATPAGVGNGGIYKTSFTGSPTTQTDNGVTFVCLWKIDYMTLSEAFNDTPTSWASGTQYYAGTYVRTGGVILQNVTAGLTTPWKCTSSGGAAPTPPGFGGGVSDGTCTWQEVVSHPVYSSQANIWLHQLCDASAAGDFPCHATPQFSAPITIYIAHEGHDATAYIPGQNNEDVPILMWSHLDFWGDQQPDYTACGPCSITVTVPAGDSFVDNISSSTALAGTPGRNYGVLLQSNFQWPLGGSANAFSSAGEPIAFSDSSVEFDRLQFQSLFGIVNAQHLSGPGWTHTNGLTFRQSTLDAGGGWGTIVCDGGCLYDSSLVVNRSLLSGSYGILGIFGTFVYDTTILGNGAPHSFGIATTNGLGSSYWYNNLTLGFPYPNARTASSAPVLGSGHNGTDVSSGCCSGATFTPSYADYSGSTMTAQQLDGTTINGMTPASELVQPVVQSPVQVTSIGGTAAYNTTSQSVGFTTLAANETAVLFISTSVSPSSVAGGGLTWVQRYPASGPGNLLEYVAAVPTIGSYTVTVTTGTTSGILQLGLIVAVGTPTSGSVFDSNGSLPAVGSTAPSMTTTTADDLLMAAYTCSNQIFDAAGPTAGWRSSSVVQMFFQYRNVNTVKTSYAPAISSPCTVTSAIGDALTQNVVASSINARIASASAQSYGGGTGTMTGTLTVPGTDILGQSRSGRVDLGAVQFNGTGPLSAGTGAGRRWGR